MGNQVKDILGTQINEVEKDVNVLLVSAERKTHLWLETEEELRFDKDESRKVVFLSGKPANQVLLITLPDLPVKPGDFYIEKDPTFKEFKVCVKRAQHSYDTEVDIEKVIATSDFLWNREYKMPSVSPDFIQDYVQDWNNGKTIVKTKAKFKEEHFWESGYQPQMKTNFYPVVDRENNIVIHNTASKSLQIKHNMKSKTEHYPLGSTVYGVNYHMTDGKRDGYIAIIKGIVEDINISENGLTYWLKTPIGRSWGDSLPEKLVHHDRDVLVRKYCLPIWDKMDEHDLNEQDPE